MAAREPADPDNVRRLIQTGWVKCPGCGCLIDKDEDWALGTDGRARCEDCKE